MTAWKQLFLLSDALERAALEHHAVQWGDSQYAGLTVSQSRAYITLWKLLDSNPDGISLKTLSQKLRVTAGAASEMVDLLVNKGLVTRTQSKSDRRAICINFPEELKRKHEYTEQIIRHEYDTFLDPLLPEEKKQFECLLQKIYDEYNKKGQI